MSDSDTEQFARVADALSEITLEMERVDLNAMLDDDIREFLDHKQALKEMTLRYRDNQHAAKSHE